MNTCDAGSVDRGCSVGVELPTFTKAPGYTWLYPHGEIMCYHRIPLGI